MKPREQVKLMILNEWLRKAQADIAVAERLVTDDTVFANAVAFHCQQASEKFIKAFLTWHQVEFPKTHDLKELLELVAEDHAALAGQLEEVAILTPYGVDLRYPGDRPDASLEEARDAVRLARKARDAILPLLPDTAEQ